MKRILLFIFLSLCGFKAAQAQRDSTFRIVGYYAGPLQNLDSFETGKLTHLIYCFGHLGGNRFVLRSTEDTLIIRRMVELKSRNPKMKVLLSLGGWGGCQTCPEVFSSAEGRKAFAISVKEISSYFKTDGIDLDWEYPGISGFPDHAYSKKDPANFTELVKELFLANDPGFEITFAAGGFTSYIDSSIEWKNILPYVSFINIMSYDLVHGFSTVSGHHTPLYSTPQQSESTDHAVQLLLQKGIPANKLVIGSAFYGRFFEINEGNPVELYMPAKFSHGFSYMYSADSISVMNGFDQYWDEIAKAPYAINKARRLVATYDNARSVALKVKYARENHLGGIMFWQLMDDKFKHGLLEVITEP